MSRPRWESRPEASVIRLALHADSTAMVMGDPVELREVLVNMIYNAADAMPSGGEIRLSAAETNGRVILTITDTGTGMPTDVKSRLFNPFFTTKGKAGTGMGLAVSFGIVRRHNGSIEVQSEIGRGTTFRISLPMTSPDSRSAQCGTPALAGSRTKQSARILIAEDEAIVRELLVEAFKAEGCEVLAAESGDRALEVFDHHEGDFDAVLTDIGLPGMSGWDLATAIRRRSETIPLAIVSGWADAISCETRNTVRPDWVISKPFDIDKISEIAAEITERKKLKELPLTN